MAGPLCLLRKSVFALMRWRGVALQALVALKITRSTSSLLGTVMSLASILAYGRPHVMPTALGSRP
eukprot:8821654-Alexandrium_andersonii.AAC.1